MALTLNDKLSRMLAFLVGLRDPRVFSVLATRGMTPAILEEGWTLFTTAAGAKLRYTPAKGGPVASGEENNLLAGLDLWENTWFPVIDATLRRNLPAVHAVVFANLAQTEGKAVIVSVGTMLERLRLPEVQKSLALLESRGLTAHVRKTAEDLLGSLKKLSETQIPDVDPTAKLEQEKALDDAWGWYREWSTIARTLFTRGDTLIRLGLRKSKRGRIEEDTEEDPAPGDPIPPS
jgi:hypothetical protein